MSSLSLVKRQVSEKFAGGHLPLPGVTRPPGRAARGRGALGGGTLSRGRRCKLEDLLHPLDLLWRCLVVGYVRVDERPSPRYGDLLCMRLEIRRIVEDDFLQQIVVGLGSTCFKSHECITEEGPNGVDLPGLVRGSGASQGRRVSAQCLGLPIYVGG